jgi:ankyrin repeat protein
MCVWILLLDYSPVAHAVSYGNLPAIKYLFDHGADLHQQRSGEVTLLHSAAIHGMGTRIFCSLSLPLLQDYV